MNEETEAQVSWVVCPESQERLELDPSAGNLFPEFVTRITVLALIGIL